MIGANPRRGNWGFTPPALAAAPGRDAGPCGIEEDQVGAAGPVPQSAPSGLERSEVDTLIASLQRLVGQSTEALGPDHPSTLMLKQQLAAAVAAREPQPKVFWLKPQPPAPADKS